MWVTDSSIMDKKSSISTKDHWSSTACYRATSKCQKSNIFLEEVIKDNCFFTYCDKKQLNKMIIYNKCVSKMHIRQMRGYN